MQFDIKDMGKVFYVINIKIERDNSRWMLRLSQEAYINNVLERFSMKDCSSSFALLSKVISLIWNKALEMI